MIKNIRSKFYLQAHNKRTNQCKIGCSGTPIQSIINGKQI